MRLRGFFFHLYKDLLNHNGKILRLIFVTLSVNSYAQAILANTVQLAVEQSGGAITNAANSFHCQQQCKIRTVSNRPLTLFAIPDRGYRFAEWGGACTGSLGPMCTLNVKAGAQASVRFVKVTSSLKSPAQALLLLHDGNQKPTVWNEYARKWFNNRCPVIYAGVILELDSADSRSNVFCYRIAFGYYQLLQQSMAERARNTAFDNANLPAQVTDQRLGYEIRAAVLGIFNRHPDIKLTLVSQNDTANAAQSFLAANYEENKNISGLLTLVSSIPAPENGQASNRIGTASMLLKATPEQGGKINAALVHLTGHPYP